MTNDRTTRFGPKAIGLAAAGVLAGVLAVAGVAAAATTDSTPSPSASSDSASGSTTDTPPAPPAGGTFDHGGSTPVRGDEQSVSSDVESKLTAAALKAVPGATVYRVETDAGDAAYEVHLEKADGSPATVKFDKDYALVEVQDGMGLGDPAPTGGPAGQGASGDASASATASA